MPGLKTNEVKLVSENGLQQKSITLDNNGILLFNGIQITTMEKEEFITLALSDETTLISNGVSKLTFRMAFPIILTKIPRASLSTASTSGNINVDINKNGVSIFSTILSIDVNEKTSTTAATSAILSTTSILDDDELTFDIDAAGTGAKGLKVTLYYKRVQ